MEKLKFNIQLFAGEGEETETPTEAVENDSVEETPDDVEFDDNSNESGNEETEDNVSEDKKKKNAEAYQRRVAEKKRKQEEAQKRAEEEAYRKAYVDGMKRSSGGRNKFTNKPIEDEADVEEYEIMLRLEEEGKDPIDDYLDELKRVKREEKAKIAEAERVEKERQEKIGNDAKEFIDKYGQDTLNKLANDPKFTKYADRFVGRIPLVEIYDSYLEFAATIENESTRLAKEKDARRQSSSGGLGNEMKADKSIKDMSDEEFSKMFNGMLQNY